MSKELYVSVTQLHDTMDCEQCGGGMASGWLVTCDTRLEINVDLTPFAHCYDSTDYSEIEHVFRSWLANNIVLDTAPTLTEEQTHEWDFMKYLMPDMYQLTKQSFYDAEGTLVEYDETICKVDDYQLMAEYLSRIFNARVHIIPDYTCMSDYDNDIEIE